jgi:hypothetical protein
MSTSLSLCATQRSAPAALPEEGDVTIAFADYFVLLAWTMLFAPEDVTIVGPSQRRAVTAFTSAAAALARLRARGPVLRAAAGEAAEGLGPLENALANADATCHVQLFVHERFDGDPGALEHLREIVASIDAPAVARWGEALDAAGLTTRLGLLSLSTHGGTLADGVTGVVTSRIPPRSYRRPAPDAGAGGLVPSLDWALNPDNPLDRAPTLEAALEQIDLSPRHLDTLTTLLLVDSRRSVAVAERLRSVHADALRRSLAEYEAFRAKHQVEAPESVVVIASGCIARCLSGADDPFAPLASVPAGVAAWAIAHAPREVPKRSKRTSLRRSPEPLAGVLARSLGPDTPSVALDRFELLDWCDGARIVRRNREPDALVAGRIDALRDATPLSIEDPLGLIEHIADLLAWNAWTEPPIGPLAMFALARALAFSRTEATAVLETVARRTGATKPTLASLLACSVRWCVTTAASLDERSRRWLLERAALSVEDALIDHADRACVRLALGDRDELALQGLSRVE